MLPLTSVELRRSGPVWPSMLRVIMPPPRPPPWSPTRLPSTDTWFSLVSPPFARPPAQADPVLSRRAPPRIVIVPLVARPPATKLLLSLTVVCFRTSVPRLFQIPPPSQVELLFLTV